MEIVKNYCYLKNKFYLIHRDLIDFGLDFNIGGQTHASNKNNRSKQVHASDEMNGRTAYATFGQIILLF